MNRKLDHCQLFLDRTHLHFHGPAATAIPHLELTQCRCRNSPKRAQVGGRLMPKPANQRRGKAVAEFLWDRHRARFVAGEGWREVRLPFAAFEPHRLDAPLDLTRVRRLGIVAIGRAFTADVTVAALALYR